LEFCTATAHALKKRHKELCARSGSPTASPARSATSKKKQQPGSDTKTLSEKMDRAPTLCATLSEQAPASCAAMRGGDPQQGIWDGIGIKPDDFHSRAPSPALSFDAALSVVDAPVYSEVDMADDLIVQMYHAM